MSKTSVKRAAEIGPSFNAPGPNMQNVIPNDEPMTPREKIEAAFPHVAHIVRDEEALQDSIRAAYDARQNALNRNAVARGDNEMEAASNADHMRPSKAIAERTAKRREALKAQRAEIDATYELQQKTNAGSALNYVNGFFASPEAFAKHKHADTVADIQPGETLRDAMNRVRAEKQVKIAEERVVMRAHPTKADIQQHAVAEVGKLAANLGLTVGSLRNLHFHERLGRWMTRSLELPKKGDSVDAVGLMFALFGDEIAERLTARALANHDESKSLDILARSQKLKAIREKILRLEYQSEAIHRLARSQGTNAGPRISSNPLAILDLVEV